MHRLIGALACIVWSVLATGCIDVNTAGLLAVGTPFVVRGTMTVEKGSCLVWQAENGQSCYLYQDPLLDNDLFNQITTPGTTSRLVVVTRSDLSAPCDTDLIVQVQSVLEVVP